MISCLFPFFLQNLPTTLIRLDPFKNFFFLELLDLTDDPIVGNADLVGHFLEGKGRALEISSKFSSGFFLWLSPQFSGESSREEGKGKLNHKPAVRLMASDYGRQFSSEKVLREFDLSFRSVEETRTDELGCFQKNGYLS